MIQLRFQLSVGDLFWSGHWKPRSQALFLTNQASVKDLKIYANVRKGLMSWLNSLIPNSRNTVTFWTFIRYNAFVDLQSSTHRREGCSEEARVTSRTFWSITEALDQSDCKTHSGQGHFSDSIKRIISTSQGHKCTALSSPPPHSMQHRKCGSKARTIFIDFVKAWCASVNRNTVNCEYMNVSKIHLRNS